MVLKGVWRPQAVASLSFHSWLHRRALSLASTGVSANVYVCACSCVYIHVYVHVHMGMYMCFEVGQVGEAPWYQQTCSQWDLLWTHCRYMTNVIHEIQTPPSLQQIQEQVINPNIGIKQCWQTATFCSKTTHWSVIIVDLLSAVNMCQSLGWGSIAQEPSMCQYSPMEGTLCVHHIQLWFLNIQNTYLVQ